MESILLANGDVEPKPKRSLLPVLVFLFVVSYGLLTMLVVEQGRTIQAQRSLLTQLLDDSFQLMKMKTREVEQKRHQAAAQAKPGGRPQTETPSTQAPQQEETRQSANKGKTRSAVPQRLPRRADDTADARRNPRII